mmetsp:Transcript_87737/g.183405  ORF Transcript_87737/g.183405 Transcript_87737/m.183405 type:complete len:413 (-) Transcript_87737:52-1290(-)|eukprot:CAMPEP_0206442468 /NCGR_PEP_ID=MMETSP0324_2-20121206/13839_1 /ASSEMBLY_ACC=CAM_ASM_000836 /TAXON_ID=2866 /ORGANISM="Crypthecodinium cohnii, Strain Seligo" /LENGTH=412 /DNA_ID=CAMNT_0053910315 /DNA_START=73 /DNA_END=1311 /DNA_ORIENTATION=-
MANYLEGLVAAFGAAVCFGVQYVPVKQYEIYDGATFQWFMAAGILLTGFLISLAAGLADVGMPLEVVFGGLLWAVSNYVVIPLVRLLGIGPGFALYHFVNLVVGYMSGRFGWFGLETLKGEHLWCCDIGALLICVSFIVMNFVEDELEPPASNDGASAMEGRLEESFAHVGASIVSANGRPVVDPTDAVVFDPNTRHVTTLQQFSATARRPSNASFAHSAREGSSFMSSNAQLEAALNVQEPNPAPADDNTPSVGSRSADRVLGAGLALLGGGLCGIQAIPSDLYLNSHKNLSKITTVLPQCMGVWLGATIIYLLHASVARLAGNRVPHSVIRPAFLSGCLWAIGFAGMITGIGQLGYSVGYTLDAVGPIIVSSLLSVFVFREISGSKQLFLYALSLSLQVMGTTLIAVFGA